MDTYAAFANAVNQTMFTATDGPQLMIADEAAETLETLQAQGWSIAPPNY